MATKNSTALKNSPKTPKNTAPKAKKLTLEEMASDENTGFSRVLHEVDMSSWEFIETLSAMECSAVYEPIRSEVKLGKGGNLFSLDLFAVRMYLAGRFDQRGEPTTK